MNEEKIDNKNYFIKNTLLYIIFSFPITSLIKSYIGPINIILTIITFILFCLVYMFDKMKVRYFFLLMYIFFTIVYNIYLNGLNFFSDNMLFYFPFLIMYFNFFIKNKEFIKEFIKKHEKFLDFIIYVFSLIIFITLFLPSSYVYEGETRGFVSLAKTTFLLCPIAMFIFAIIGAQYIFNNKKKKYLLLLVFPIMCILLGSTRTYLGVLACAIFCFIYVIIKEKKNFIPLTFLMGTVFILIVLISPIKEKFTETIERSELYGIDPLEAFTSGRSEFWVYDLNCIFKSDFNYFLLGHGINYLYEINYIKFGNPLWAHNDFIQIISDYGLIGLLIYLYMFIFLIKNFFKNIIINKKILIIICTVMWAFNAFFNMFYTYFCACLSYPFFLLLIENSNIQSNTKENINIKHLKNE